MNFDQIIAVAASQGGGFGPAQSAFTQTLASDIVGWLGYTVRSSTSSALSVGGGQIRVTFEAPASGNMIVNNAAIGIKGTDQQTTATPVELKFSGASGFTISNGATLVSDWATLATTASDSVVVICDINNGAASSLRAKDPTTDATSYKAAAASYADANPAGMTTSVDYALAYNKIEVR